MSVRRMTTLVFACVLATAGIAAVAYGAVINGTTGNDNLVGTANKDTIDAKGGHDDVDGRGGNDTIYGGPGDDNIFGKEGLDKIHGEQNDDWIDGGNDFDEIYGDGGSDTLFGVHGGINNGGDGNDWILTGALMHGGPGNDDILAASLDGTGWNQLLQDLFGENGNDDIVSYVDYGYGFQFVSGGGGTDVCWVNSYDPVDTCETVYIVDGAPSLRGPAAEQASQEAEGRRAELRRAGVPDVRIVTPEYANDRLRARTLRAAADATDGDTAAEASSKTARMLEAVGLAP